MKIEMCDEFFYRVNEDNEKLFEKFNTSKENVLRNNNNLKFYAGEVVKIKLNDYVLHRVKPAETLKDIARIYDVEIQEIKIKNNLTLDKLFIGQEIKIYKKKDHWFCGLFCNHNCLFFFFVFFILVWAFSCKFFDQCV